MRGGVLRPRVASNGSAEPRLNDSVIQSFELETFHLMSTARSEPCHTLVETLEGHPFIQATGSRSLERAPFTFEMQGLKHISVGI